MSRIRASNITISGPSRRFLALSAIAASLAFPAGAHAQQADDAGVLAADDAASDPGIIVTGTRTSGRLARNSPTPIDVISGSQLNETGQVDLRRALMQLSPSISQQAFAQNGAAFKATVSMAGLGVNQALVLVNGKRRHTTANITVQAGPQQGTTGVDLDLIPVSAIERIEILKDGDSAQYGADAIAGVINIILKSADHGGSAQGTVSQYYAGDGFSRQLSANAGLPLGEDGFFNISAEYSGRDHTRRIWLATTPPQRSPNELDADRASLAANGSYSLGGGVELYGFATYARREATNYNAARLGTSLPQVYPNGYTPQQTIDEDDFAVTAGLKAKDVAGWTVDVSGSYSGDYVSFDLFESANLGYYSAYGTTPTSFHVYSISSRQLSGNLDVTRAIDVPGLSSVNLSFGAEARKEYYAIRAGEPASYFSTGSQGQPGLSPLSAGDFSRSVLAGYVDVAAQITPEWQVDLAGRFEGYSDTDDTLVGKIATRYAFSPAIALRASAGLGFGAPTLAQQYFLNISTGQTSATAFLAANSAAAQSLGSQPLQPERSTNYNLGLVISPSSNSSITIDAYQIEIRDRIVPGGTVSGATAVAALALAGFTPTASMPASQISASYLTNGADTRTRGINVTASYRHGLGSLGQINWTLAGTLIDTDITKLAIGQDGNPILDVRQRGWLTTAAPKYKVILGADWTIGRLTLSAQENFYGATTNHMQYYTGPNAYSTLVFSRFRSSPKATTNVSARYAVTDGIRLSVGANNLFNVYPDRLPVENRLQGLRYDMYQSQLGVYGGSYYASAQITF